MSSKQVIGRSGHGEDYNRNLSLLFYFFIFCMLLLVGRLWFLQVIKGEQLRKFSQRNRIELKKEYATRGIIYDRYGKVIAGNRPSYDLELVRSDLNKSVDKALLELRRLLGEENFDLDFAERQLRKARGRYRPVLLKSDLTADDLAKLEVSKYRLPGIRVTLRAVRKYLHGATLSHLLGTVGEINRLELNNIAKKSWGVNYRQGDFIGKSGVEKSYEKFLRGTDGEWPVVLDAHGREIERPTDDSLLPSFRKKNSIPGNDLYLTIDLDLQLKAEELFGFARGAVVVLNPQSGEVLTLLSKPSYDPSKFTRGVSKDYWQKLLNDPDKPLTDRALQGQYPPGSTFKIVAATAALEEGLVTIADTFKCTGSFRLGRETKHCWKAYPGHGLVNFHNSLKQSCDVYYYNIGNQLGIATIASYARKVYGFGEISGIGINGEKKGLIPDPAWKERVYQQPWVGGETLSVAIGQGFTLVTPLQLAVAYAVIANGGDLLQAQVVNRIESPTKKIIRGWSVQKRRSFAFRPGTLEALRQGLLAAVNEPKGTAYWSGRSRKVKIAGKTGTAQVVSRIKILKHEKYLQDHAWFVAFAPAEEPEIVVVVLAENAGHGSTAAAPISKKLIEFYFDKKNEGKKKQDNGEEKIKDNV